MKEINSLNDLYLKLKPALKVKTKEASRLGLNINEIEIWNYLADNWRCEVDLDLNDMVKDILNLNLKEWRKYE